MKLPQHDFRAGSVSRYLFFTGKGGVGKTSLACTTALALADQGKRVLLVSTDPASNLDEVLDTRLSNQARAVAGVPGMEALNIDPVAAAEAYRERLIAPMRGLLPETALRRMEEQLSGSCTVKIAAFDEFAALIGDPAAVRDYQYIVFDTAPTGHTLLLLDASKAYQREMARQARNTAPEEVAELLKRLRDPSFTRILLVTLPEATPVHEAALLQDDLRRASIEPFAWVINQSLCHSGTRNPLLRGRVHGEQRYLREVVETQARRTAWLPWRAEEPVGVKALAHLAESQIPSTAATS